ncbi:unnamed protein product [Amoebophrya sp. A120]|nr:unnamed protein product [Amoebophrya sp. A120]|eukprot:GSA120T00011982001.1
MLGPMLVVPEHHHLHDPLCYDHHHTNNRRPYSVTSFIATGLNPRPPFGFYDTLPGGDTGSDRGIFPPANTQGAFQDDIVDDGAGNDGPPAQPPKPATTPKSEGPLQEADTNLGQARKTMERLKFTMPTRGPAPGAGKTITQPNDKLNLLTWHKDIITDSCDPLVMWKVRKAIVGLKWHLISMRDPTALPSKAGKQYFSDKIVNQLTDMERRVMSWGYSYDPYPIPKCARDGYWNGLQNEVRNLRELLLQQFAYAIQSKQEKPETDVMKSYQRFLFENFVSQMKGGVNEDSNYLNNSMQGGVGSTAGKNKTNVVTDTGKAIMRGMSFEPAYTLSTGFFGGNSKPVLLPDGQPAYLPGPRARPKAVKYEDNENGYVTLDDINTIMRYLEDLWDTVHAVPRHGELALQGPSMFASNMLTSAANSVGQVVKNAFGLKGIPPASSVITLKQGTKVKSNGALKRFANFFM